MSMLLFPARSGGFIKCKVSKRLCPSVRASVRPLQLLNSWFVNFKCRFWTSHVAPQNNPQILWIFHANSKKDISKFTNHLKYVRRTDGHLRRAEVLNTSRATIFRTKISEVYVKHAPDYPPRNTAPRNSRGIALSILCGSYRESVLYQCAGGRRVVNVMKFFKTSRRYYF